MTGDGPLAIHQLALDLNNTGVRLGVALAHDRLISDDETVSSMVCRSGAVAGVNADFFDISESGMPLNIMVQGGRLLRSPSRRVALAIRPDGGVEIDRYEWNGAVVNLATRAAHWLAGFNTGFVPNEIVAISNVRGYGAPVPGPGVKQTVVELAPASDVVRNPGAPLAASLVPIADPESRYTVKALWTQQAPGMDGASCWWRSTAASRASASGSRSRSSRRTCGGSASSRRWPSTAAGP